MAILMSDDPGREILRNNQIEEKGRLLRAQQQLQKVLGSGDDLLGHDTNNGASGAGEKLGSDVEMYGGPALKSEIPRSRALRTPGMLKI